MATEAVAQILKGSMDTERAPVRKGSRNHMLGPSTSQFQQNREPVNSLKKFQEKAQTEGSLWQYLIRNV